MDGLLATHLIDPATLRDDNFTKFFEDRKTELLKLIEKAIGKTILPTVEVPEEGDFDEDVEDDQMDDEEIEAAATEAPSEV